MPELPDTDFWKAFQRKSSGILKWRDMEALWDRIAADPDEWFIFNHANDPPENVVSPMDLAGFLDAAAEFVRTRQKGDICGCIYVDDADKPSLVRIYDPKNMGSACGCSGERVFPKWTLSRLKPDAMPTTQDAKTKGGWVSRILKKAS